MKTNNSSACSTIAVIGRLYIMQAEATQQGLFLAFYRAHANVIEKVIRSFVLYESDRDDLRQELLIRLYRSADKLCGVVNAREYIYRIFSNLYVRPPGSRKREIVRSFDPIAIRKTDDRICYNEFAFKDVYTVVSLAIDSLPTQTGRAYHLCRACGLSREEAAAVLRVQPMTVKNQIAAADAMLAEKTKELLRWPFKGYSVKNKG